MEKDILSTGYLPKYIKGVFDKLESDYYEHVDATVKIVLGGDKGGKSMKFHFEISHPRSSVFDVHIFSMYEGSDCLNNMAKVLKEFAGDFEKMADESFRLRGRKIEFFLGGDFKFLDGVMGTQGSSAKMPCSKCKVTLDHLQNHGHSAHGQQICQIPMRTLGEMESRFNENLADDRCNKGSLDLCSTGKFHESIVGRNLFKFVPLINVVPPVLHILLGIVLRLFKKLLVCCRSLDGFKSSSDFDKNDQEWKEKSREVQAQEEVVRDLGFQHVDLQNIGDRLTAKSAGEIDLLAQQSEFQVKKRQKQEKCGSVCCIISEFDSNVNWVACNSCGKWLHVLCEGFASSELDKVKSQSRYECLHCLGVTDRDSLIHFNQVRVNELFSIQNEEEKRFSALSEECSLLKEKVENMVGPFEKKLMKVLDDIGVDRQAYHSNSFVGNHCRKILANVHLLCDVVSKSEPIFSRHLKEVFTTFTECYHQMSKKTALSDKDIESLTASCKKFGEIYPEYFPEPPCLTRKMHELICHLPEFALKHRTVGLFSEEDGESVHRFVNVVNRQFASVRKTGERAQLVHKTMELLCSTSRQALVPRKRECVLCGSCFCSKFTP